MELQVPQTLRLEHVKLREELYALTKESDGLSEAARVVMELFYMHAIKEEGRVLPALEFLPLLSKGQITDSMRYLKDIAADLKGGLYEELLDDHKAIVAGLKNLSESALLQGRKEPAQFVERFILHAQMEEEILYPASLLTAEYFQLLMQCGKTGG